jgi:diguanylate cyclase (GGDEF)-like protein
MILDWMMPGITGVEIVRRLRERPDGHTYYIIILTSLDTPRDLAHALEGGADEFISKPFYAEALRARVNVGRRIANLHESLSEKMRLLSEANETISRLAATDELTGLPNRRFFNESLTAALSAAHRHKFSLSLIMTDIDRFKTVNDLHGHTGGDKVLKAFAEIIRRMSRTEDVSARWGGEEFIFLLTHTPLEGAAVLAERIRSMLESESEKTTSIAITASFGVAGLHPGEDADALIRRADAALYRAKNEGRNKVVLAD